MRLSTRTLYGTQAMIELALAYGRGPLSTQAIAKRQVAPYKYLEQVLVDLRRAGLLASSRGPQGGYELAMPPSEITMKDIYHVTEGGGALVPEIQRERSLRHPHVRVPALYWREAFAAWLAELDSTTLAQLSERYRRAKPSAGMYYI